MNALFLQCNWPLPSRVTALSKHLALALTWLALLCAGPALSASDELNYNIKGEARDLRTGDLLYLEFHSCDELGLLCSVSYRGDAGEVFAEKSLDYTAAAIAPRLEMNDIRLARELQVETAETGVVVDAGFDNFLRSNWEALDRGERVKFPFLLPGRDKPLPMSAERSSKDCTPELLCVEVKLSSWFLAALTSPIELSYSRDSRRLMRYRGISNLRGPDGDSQMVDIRYLYQD